VTNFFASLRHCILGVPSVEPPTSSFTYRSGEIFFLVQTFCRFCETFTFSSLRGYLLTVSFLGHTEPARLKLTDLPFSLRRNILVSIKTPIPLCPREVSSGPSGFFCWRICQALVFCLNRVLQAFLFSLSPIFNFPNSPSWNSSGRFRRLDGENRFSPRCHHPLPQSLYIGLSFCAPLSFIHPGDFFSLAPSF